MIRRIDLVVPGAAALVVVTALLGGGFYPLPRMIVAGALSMVWVLAAVGTRGRLDATEWLLAGVMGWGLVAAIWVGASPLAAKEALTIWITALFLFGLCRRGGDESRRRALETLVIGAAVVAAAVLIEALGEGIRVGGLFENPNVAAGVLVPTLPLGWWVLDGSPRWRWSWSALVTVGVIGTGSRAGLLAALVAIGVMLPRGRLRQVGVLAGSALASGVLLWRFLSQPDVLAWHRISIWWAVVKIWATRPLTGVGPGALVEAAGVERILHPEEIGRYQFVIGYSESTPLAIFVQTGLVGLLLSVLAAIAWLVTVRRSGGLGARPLVAAMIAMAVLALFHDFLTIDPVLWWWAVVVGCVGGMSTSSSSTRSSAWPVLVRWSIVLVVIWATAWGLITPAYARWVWQHGQPTTAQVVRTLRIEPWLSAAPAARVRRMLASDDPWSWRQAAEADHWADVACRARPGFASRWADLGRVHLRILTDLGGTDHDVEAARTTLARACELDPRLPWYWLERARLERLNGKLETAVRWTRHALKQEPNTIRGWLYLSRLELDRGQLKAALSAFAEAEQRLVLRDRPGLSDYERELLKATPDQLVRQRAALGQLD